MTIRPRGAGDAPYLKMKKSIIELCDLTHELQKYLGAFSYTVHSYEDASWTIIKVRKLHLDKTVTSMLDGWENLIYPEGEQVVIKIHEKEPYENEIGAD